jgi:transposase InsO family protein
MLAMTPCTKPEADARSGPRESRLRAARVRPSVGRQHHPAPHLGGVVYVAIVVDAGRRRVVGWAMADNLRAELIVEALQMAVAAARPSPAWCITQTGCPGSTPP